MVVVVPPFTEDQKGHPEVVGRFVLRLGQERSATKQVADRVDETEGVKQRHAVEHANPNNERDGVAPVERRAFGDETSCDKRSEIPNHIGGVVDRLTIHQPIERVIEQIGDPAAVDRRVPDIASPFVSPAKMNVPEPFFGRVRILAWYVHELVMQAVHRNPKEGTALKR
jgi:hypothetical protein